MDLTSNVSVLKGPSRPLTPILLHKIFEKIANSALANNTALIFEECEITKKYSYKELNNLTNRLARTIRQTILDERLPRNKDGDLIVAVSMHPSDYAIITLLAIWKAGAAYLPLDPTFRVDHILGEAKPALVIFDGEARNFGGTFKLSIKEFLSSANNSSLNQNSLSDEEQRHDLKDDLAIILYTSGSTGVPKGVRLTHTSILNRLQWQFKTFPYGENENTGVFKTTLTFVDSVMEIWGPLLNGLAILVVPKAATQNPEELVRFLEKYKIERLVLVPSLLRSLLTYLQFQKGEKYLKNLKLWTCTSETLHASLAKKFYKYFSADQHQLCNLYGTTEVMGDVTFHILSSLELHHEEKVPIGIPMDNTIIYLLNSNLYPVKIGELGELFISGSNLASGYVNGRDPDKFLKNPFSAEPMFAKLYRTGDFARIHNGVLLYEGRTDSQVKIRGHRVDLSEIEKVLNEIEGVDKGVVLCHKPGEADQAILAFVTSDGSLNEKQIERILRMNLAPYMIPQVVLVEDIPLLINGKIDRQELLGTYESFQIDIDYIGVLENQMAAAKVLFETVASLSGRFAKFTININSNFYEIGGTSLNSIYTISKLSEAGYHISIHDFIMAANMGEILNKLSSDKPRATPDPLPYITEPLQDGHKEIVTEMMITSFYHKSPLERWLLSELSESSYKEFMEQIWEHLLEQDLSFMIKTKNGKIVGVSLNHDALESPRYKLNSKLEVQHEFIIYIEKPALEELVSKKGTVFSSSWLATHSTLTPKENVSVFRFMEEETLRFAKSRGFSRVIATNVSPLTQQLATDVYGFETYLDYQVNQFVASDNSKPYGMAPDSQRVLIQWKDI